MEIDLSRFRIDSMTAKLKLTNHPDEFKIVAVMNIRDVKDGRPNFVYSQSVFFVRNRENFKEVAAHTLLNQLVKMMAHELDECLYVDGERLCKNPHPERT